METPGTNLSGLPKEFVSAYRENSQAGDDKTIVRVALYSRVSTPFQTLGEFSADDKQSYGLESAVAQRVTQGWRITHDLSEGAKSGRKRNRAKIQEALRLARAREYDVLLVQAQARLARDAEFTMGFVKELERNGVEIWTVTGQRISVKGTNFVITGVTAVLDEFESIRISERIAPAMAKRAALGLYHGGIPPPGYFYVDGKKGEITPNSAMAVVHEIFSRTANNETVGEVELDLERRGLITPPHIIKSERNAGKVISGYRYTRPVIIRIIRNPVYRGLVPCQNWEEHKAYLDKEPVTFIKGIAMFRGLQKSEVSDEVWQSANDALDYTGKPKRKPKTADVEGVWLNQGRVECVCGRSMTTKYVGKADAANRKNYYVCSSQITSNGRAPSRCGLPVVPAQAVDRCVIHYLSTMFQRPELLEIATESQEECDETSIDDLKNEMDAMRASIRAIAGLFVDLKMTARSSLAEQMRSLSAKEVALQRRITSFGMPRSTNGEAQAAAIEELKDVAAKMASAARCELKKLVGIWIRSVTISTVNTGVSLRSFKITLDLKFKAIASDLPYIFTVQETAPRSGDFRIVAPFKEAIDEIDGSRVDESSPAALLTKVDEWKQDIARGRNCQKTLAGSLGKSEAWVSQTLRISKIPASIRARLVRGKRPGITRNFLLRLASRSLDEMEWEVRRLFDTGR